MVTGRHKGGHSSVKEDSAGGDNQYACYYSFSPIFPRRLNAMSAQ